jgi:phage N-6-adenine-methyltransferase
MQLSLDLNIDSTGNVSHSLRVQTSSAKTGNGKDEWYTPRHIVERAIAFFGEIDLDPCSNSHEAPNVPAHRLFTAQDDGLTLSWKGDRPQRVWLNPPYSENRKWANKVVSEWGEGNIEEILILVPNRLGVQWFETYMAIGPIVAPLRGRLTFGDATSAAPFESILIYGGDRMEDFRSAFGDLVTCFLITN